MKHIKRILLFSLLLVSSFAFAAFGQSVVITPKKLTYRRPKPLDEYKRSFTVTYPRVSGLSSALNKRVETTISYEKAADLDIKNELGGSSWLEEASYRVNYNKNGILDIRLNVSGLGAYPDEYERIVVVNLKTGDRVKPTDVFVNLNGLAAKCRRIQKTEIKRSLTENKESDPELFAEAKFTVDNLKEFTISDRGVAFLYDYGFPHVAKALQPDGRYFIPWVEMKPFIKRSGLLARFVR